MKTLFSIIGLLLVLACVACSRPAAKAPAANPAVATGSFKVAILLPRTVEADGWTVRTKDGGLSAQFEHDIAITRNGPEILSIPDPEFELEDGL